MNDRARTLLEALESHRATVGVIGLGYVGLPLALAFTDAGISVLGFDVDADKVGRIDRGESYIGYISSRRIAAARAAGRLSATADLARLGEPDVLIICVPTPLKDRHEPDLSHIETTGGAIAATLRPGQLVVLESTTYPGTTEEVLQPLLEGCGLVCGEDFFLAYSPEREDPGNPKFDVRTIPKVVGGVDAASARLVAALYAQVTGQIVGVSSTRVAEATKLTENIYRAVNIALVNELKIIFDEMGIDVWEVLDAAATKPFGFTRFEPGPGWGGHCIPIDPFYLAWKARQVGATTRFIELAGEINQRMPRYVFEKLERALAARDRALDGGRILVVGLAYKRDVPDPRESPAFELISLLVEAGAQVEYHDPHIAQTPTMRSWSDLGVKHSVELTPEVLRAQDAVVIVTNHSDLDYDLLLEYAPLVIDTRGVYRRPADSVVKA